MSKNKWRVERERHAYTGELMPGWVVKKQEDESLPTFKTWWKGATWETWQEALAYADKRARTREVVLPRVDNPTSIDENDLDIMVVSVANGIGIAQPKFGKPGEDEVICMYPEFVEEVALALLAHARKERP